MRLRGGFWGWVWEEKMFSEWMVDCGCYVVCLYFGEIACDFRELKSSGYVFVLLIMERV